MSLLQSSKKKDNKRVLSGSCPDPRCQARLFFPAPRGSSSASIECTECGQRHEQSRLVRVEEVTDPDVVLHNLLRNALLGVTGPPKRGTELVKVMGLSNYHCKLLSPVLTRYGMDKQTGKAKLLRDMNQGEMFDCSLLGDRAFAIEPDRVSAAGYGRDRSGSLAYLRDTLEEVKKANGGVGECLIPVHVDGDGHCLVHAVSRALVGRELFWHALRENLKRDFEQNLDRYKALFQDFIDVAEWEDIVSECDPSFVPPEGVPLGLRNIHIFGLANVLHRPIILLDSLSGMRSPGDYSATFLPGLVSEERCRGKDGALHKPICIAWSSSGRNHYIPLVGIKDAAPPKLPARLLPKAWGVPQELIRKYVELEPDGSCVIGGDRGLRDEYLLRLVRAMEEVFTERHGIHPSLVADVHQYVYRRTGVIGVGPEEVTEAARKSVTENRLHRCLICGALSELYVPPEWLVPGGKLYDLAESTHGQLRPDKNYSFPLNNVVCSYDPRRDVLTPDYKLSSLDACNWCHGASVRRVLGDGAVVYLDGDRTDARSQGGKCGCGFKHFWEGKEYDNLPEAFPITLEWAGRAVRETVYWFQYEAAEPALNSNVYDVAMKLVTKHFPGEFGSETLVQKVVNTILHHTAKKNPDEYNPVSVAGAHDRRVTDGVDADGAATEMSTPPTKIILTGQKTKTIHKEELTMSRAERGVQRSVSEQAVVNQRRRTDKLKQDQKAQDQKAQDQKAQDQKAQDHKAQDHKAQDQKTPGGSPETTSSSSAPATPTKSSSSPSSSNQEKKIRVTTSDGRQAMLTLRARTTFSELQARVAGQFGVPAARQCIRHGFPPRELPPPRDGEENEPAALQHGDRVTVEILRAPEDPGGPAPAVLGASGCPPASGCPSAVKTEDAVTSGRTSGRELQDSIDLEMSSLCLLATLMGEDVWSYAKKLPHLFLQSGVFYNIVKKDMGLMDGKHCTLPHLTGKTFAYNAAEERLELCVDSAGHFPVGPDVEELVKEALVRLRSEAAATRGSREGSPSHGALRPGGGGVVRKKEHLQSVAAFQGKGHSLGGSSPPEQHRPITRQHSSGVDLSASASATRVPLDLQDLSDLSDVPEDAAAAREPVRVAPGFVTTKDGRGPDPGLMEQQRRKLQEMVSSIQASMERHLREQQSAAAAAAGGGTNEPGACGQPAFTADDAKRPAAVGKPDGKREEPEEMDSQDGEQSNATEPMDHS